MKQETDRLLEEKRQATARDVKIQEEIDAALKSAQEKATKEQIDAANQAAEEERLARMKIFFFEMLAAKAQFK
jgi:hypothetical protein